jgi:alkylation response protein AidB-like acyl-CoA dehydrogenase
MRISAVLVLVAIGVALVTLTGWLAAGQGGGRSRGRPRAESVLTPGRSTRHLSAETARWSTITQIYEGTNQIQRLVMVRPAPEVLINGADLPFCTLTAG